MTSKGDVTIDVGAWLRELGLGQYEAAFRDNEVNENVLPKLTQEDLKEIGVGPVGHRRIILDAIAGLRTGAGAKSPPPVTGDQNVPHPRLAIRTADLQDAGRVAAGKRQMEKLLTADEVAAYLHVSRYTLGRWRRNGEGPKASAAGKGHGFMYRLSDLQAYVQAHTSSSRPRPRRRRIKRHDIRVD